MLPTPLGPLWLAFSAKGLTAIHFNTPRQVPGPVWPVNRREAALTAHLRQWRQEVAAALEAYFAGKPTDFRHLTLDLHGTPFQLQVWEVLRQVPFGQRITYQKLAQAVGRPRAARAIGGALRANPLPIIIPCHRVIASDGSLGGYRSGLNYKQALLSWERQIIGQKSKPPS
jgi:O-6-methylguanine DNA methyltransferase